MLRRPVDQGFQVREVARPPGGLAMEGIERAEDAPGPLARRIRPLNTPEVGPR